MLRNGVPTVPMSRPAPEARMLPLTVVEPPTVVLPVTAKFPLALQLPMLMARVPTEMSVVHTKEPLALKVKLDRVEPAAAATMVPVSVVLPATSSVLMDAVELTVTFCE